MKPATLLAMHILKAVAGVGLIVGAVTIARASEGVGSLLITQSKVSIAQAKTERATRTGIPKTRSCSWVSNPT